MESPTKLTSVRKMHNIVWILLGVFTLFAATFPTALWRVSQMDKFRGFHVKSLSLEGKLPPITDKK
jgi:hypothetical protein